MRRTLLVVAALSVFSYAFAQRTVQGNVTDKEDNQPLPGVNVLVSGTNNGTATDAEGNFTLTLEDNQDVLIFSFIGYKTLNVTVGDQTQLSIQLESDIQSLEEVVVIGYGVQQKSDLTGAVASVRGADLTKIPAVNPAQALMGKVAGVQVTNASGAPGAAPVVRIRGVGTFNNAGPIYVVDGVILDDITFLNTNDIASMEVLKDASATAIYGSRGANGVIIITTKQGTPGREALSINFLAEYSIQQQQRKIDLLSGPEFASVVNEITPGSYNNVNAVPNTDWQDELFRTAPIQNYQFSATGSTEKIQYYFGLGYFKQDGIIRKSDYERLSIKLNATYHLAKWARVGNNITIAPYWQQNTNGNAVFTAYRAQPVVTPFQPDGSYSPVPGVGNVLADIEYTNSFNNGVRPVGNFFGEIDFLEGLTFGTSFGVDADYVRERSFTPVFFVSPQQQVSQSVLNKNWRQRFSWLWENTLTFNKTIDKHKFNVLAGFTTQESTSENVQLQGRDITRSDEDFWYINNNNLFPQLTVNEVNPDYFYSIVSILGRINYTFDERFLLTATIRRDGSSKFRGSNRYGNFPSVALGWNIINEAFMQDAPWLTNLKLRGSWGIIGNEKINYLQQYSVVNNGINAVLGVNEDIITGQTYGVSGNPDLKWETTQQLNIGLELGLLDNRLTAELEYYNRTTEDILIGLAIPGFLGNGNAATITYNAAEVNNKGFEANLNWREDFESGSFYRIGAVATTVDNEVNKVSGTGGSDDFLFGVATGTAITRTEVGLPIGSFYGYRTQGVFQNEADLASYPRRSDAGVGDLRFEDTDGNGVINDNDRVNLGSPIPTFIYGFTIEGGYKNFTLSLDFNGQSGNKIYNIKETIRPDLYNFEQHVADRWRGEGSSTNEPRASAGGYNWLRSDRFIQDGSYFRLRSITLSYGLPTAFAERLRMKSAQVYLRGTNVFTVSDFTGYTPEVTASNPALGAVGNPIFSGIDLGTYPIPAIYSAGVNITF